MRLLPNVHCSFFPQAARLSRFASLIGGRFRLLEMSSTSLVAADLTVLPAPEQATVYGCALSNGSYIVIDTGAACSWNVQATKPAADALMVLPWFAEPRKLINLQGLSKKCVAGAFAGSDIACLAFLAPCKTGGAGPGALAGEPGRVLVACNGPQLRGHFIVAGNRAVSFLFTLIRSFLNQGVVRHAVRCAVASLDGAAASPIADYDLLVRPAERPLWFRFAGDRDAIRNKPMCTVVALLRNLCAGASSSTVTHEALQRRAPVPAGASTGAGSGAGQSVADEGGEEPGSAIGPGVQPAPLCCAPTQHRGPDAKPVDVWEVELQRTNAIPELLQAVRLGWTPDKEEAALMADFAFAWFVVRLQELTVNRRPALNRPQEFGRLLSLCDWLRSSPDGAGIDSAKGAIAALRQPGMPGLLGWPPAAAAAAPSSSAGGGASSATSMDGRAEVPPAAHVACQPSRPGPAAAAGASSSSSAAGRSAAAAATLAPTSGASASRSASLASVAVPAPSSGWVGTGAEPSPLRRLLTSRSNAFGSVTSSAAAALPSKAAIPLAARVRSAGSGAAVTSASHRTGLPQGSGVARGEAGDAAAAAPAGVAGASKATAILEGMHVEAASGAFAFTRSASAQQDEIAAAREVRREWLRKGRWQDSGEACRDAHVRLGGALRREGSPFYVDCISFLLRDAEGGEAWAVALAVLVSQAGARPEYRCLLHAGFSDTSWHAALLSADRCLGADIKIVEVPVEHETDLGAADAGIQARYSGLATLRSLAKLEEIGTAQGITAAVTAAAQQSCALMRAGDAPDLAIRGAIARFKQSRGDEAGRAAADSRGTVAAATGAAASSSAASSSAASAGDSAGSGSFLDAVAAAEARSSFKTENRAATHEPADAIAEQQKAAAGAAGINGARRVSFAPERPAPSGAWRELGQHAGAPCDHVSAAVEPTSSAMLEHHLSGGKRGRAAAALPPPAALVTGSVAEQPKRPRM